MAEIKGKGKGQPKTVSNKDATMVGGKTTTSGPISKNGSRGPMSGPKPNFG